MYTVHAYPIEKHVADICPLSFKRSWMDETYEGHAYHCFPVTLANSLGWGVSFPEDISFIWDGITSPNQSHIKIVSGEKYISLDRSNATISLNTGIVFKTEKNVSLLTMGAPNEFVDGLSPFTTIISSSFFPGQMPCVFKITKPNELITIKAGTVLFSIIPISLSEMNNSNLIIEAPSSKMASLFDMNEYDKKKKEIIFSGKWTGFYRNATDHNGNKIGEHEVKKIIFNIKENNNERN